MAGLVEEALAVLPTLADTFEIIVVNDGSRDRTQAIADELTASNPGVVRAVHHPVNRGYGGALRSGFGAARFELVAFTDGDRQFQVVDLGRLTARFAEPDAPDVVAGYRIARADPLIRTIYAKAYRLANRIFFGLRVTDVDCACKLFRSEALDGVRVESEGAFFSAELLIKLKAAGRTTVEVGVPHYARTAGSPTGAKPQVDPPRGTRLLAPAAVHVGQPRACAPARRPDPGTATGTGRRRDLAPGSARVSSRGPPAPGRRRANSRSRGTRRAADRRPRPRRSTRSARRPRRRPARPRRRGRPGPAPTGPRRWGHPTRTASASASDGRASISPSLPSRSTNSRAWYVSSTMSEITTRATVASSASSVLANRSWVRGRSGVRPWSRIAIELASHGPIQMGR